MTKVVSMQTSNTKQTCVFLGSVPMSLNELTLAPAILSAEITKKGHDFEFIDTNLELYYECNQKIDLYHEKIEFLQDFKFNKQDLVIDSWLSKIYNKLQNTDIVLVNVFSHLSQPTALKFCQLAKKANPNIKILLGGIGSHKLFNNSTDKNTLEWIHENFANIPSLVFGDILKANDHVEYWQEDASHSVLDEAIPTVHNCYSEETFHFHVYDIDRYEWSNIKSIPMLGSYGCVRQCSFCDVIKHFPRYSFIEADVLTKEIVQAYKQTGIPKISFMDSLVNGSLKNFENLLRNLAHSKSQGWLPENFSWSGTYICRSKNTVLLDRIHELLPLSGAHNLVIGVESGSDKIRFEMQKKFTNDDLIFELSAFRRHSIKTLLLFFPAWPTETITDFEETLDLFRRLGEFAQSGTIDSISLSTHGFTLIDGTPIDNQKDELGIKPGPIPWLWHCESNPELNFWESLRRRLLSIEVAMYYGLHPSVENVMRRHLITSLQLYFDTILNYVGKLPCDIMDFDSTLKTLPNTHTLTIDVINSGTDSVNVSIDFLNDKISVACNPGITPIKLTGSKIFEQEENFNIYVEFNEMYQPNWDQHDNREYYSKNGIYIDNIYIDNKNITLWGFDLMMDQHISNKSILPNNFYSETINKRCVAIDTDLTCTIPSFVGMHQHIWNVTNSELYNEKKFVDAKLARTLKTFA